MIESLRIFRILLHKCWLVRKRQWITSIIGEIVLPVTLLFCGWILLGIDMEPSQPLDSTGGERKISSQVFLDEIANDIEGKIIAYTPTNDFTDELMCEVSSCLKHKPNITRFRTEAELVAHFYDENFLDHIMGIVFDKSTDESTTHLHYKLRSININLNTLFNEKYSNYTDYYLYKTFVIPIQYCLDKSFLKIKSNISDRDLPEVSIQEFPYPSPYVTRTDFDQTLYFFVIIFIIPSFIETSKATKEKFVGLNVLMSMNGISNTLNFLSWIVSDLLLLSILCVISISLMFTPTPGNELVFMTYGNPLIVFLIFMVHLGHSLTLGIHLSAYFSKGFHLTLALIIANALAIFIRFYILEYTNLYLAPYLGIIFPMILLYQAMAEIDEYESIGVGVQWNNLFVNSCPVSSMEGTTGMVLIFSVVGMIFHFSLAIYVYTINPGKYGIKKHPLFFLKRKVKPSSSDKVDNSMYENMDEKYFEPIPSGVYIPGIQIRNLKKAYDISMFSKTQVHALRGVSVDFYKGQITSLLGHNGAGKSTLMSILTGMINPSEGTILIDSKSLEEHASEILKDVGLCAQDDMYFPSLTVAEQLEFFITVKRKGKSNFAIKDDVEDLLHRLKLFNVKDALPNSLSGDQRRKLCLGIAFAGDPSTLILDEPTASLDHESKRLIWNILMKMRGQKTILISTHDMEEADILGNRIAIMDEGLLRSYGTSFYLKKMIAGQNNVEIVMSIERWSNHERIRVELHNEAKIIEKLDKQITVSIPISANLQNSLDNLECKKTELGVSNYHLCKVCLGKIFIKVTEDSDNPSKVFEVITSDEVKLKGSALYLQMVYALFAKKLSYSLKDLTIIMIQIFTVLLPLLGIYTVLMSSKSLHQLRPEPLMIRPQLYDKPYTLCKISNDNIANEYLRNSEAFGAKSGKINNTNLRNELMKRAEEDLIEYNNRLIAAAEFNETSNESQANAFYSKIATFSLPISVNLLWNSLISNLLSREYSVELTFQVFWATHVNELRRTEALQSYMIAIIFAIPLYFIVAMFAIHPSREVSGGIKHLQKMTGVSGFTYWGTIFLHDLMVYLIIVVLMIIGLVCIDYSLGLQLHRTNEILIMILLLMLFAINALPLAYIVSFVKMKTNTVVKLLIFIPVGIVVIHWLVLFWKYIHPDEKESYFIQGFLLILPHVSFLNGQIDFYRIGILNSICRRLPDQFYEFHCQYSTVVCCDETAVGDGDCHDRKCQKLISYFEGDNVDSLRISIMFLSATPVLYFGILAVLESRFIQKMLIKIKKQIVPESRSDEQVQEEKSIVFETIQKLKKNRIAGKKAKDDPIKNQIFLTYELRKHYRKIRAVEDVSFGIKKDECFGVFGVNSSGKSTLLNMITGEKIPDHGILYIEDKDFENNEKYFLSQIGYCPQHDVSLKCLNSYDHLRLFARLRGIPESHIDNEVDAWIERLNLNSWASLPSGTYSNGNKQRLNIAIALIGNPKLVLLDEPTMRVDLGVRRSFWNIIKSCQMAGQTFLLASHNMEECEAVCNRMTIMSDGKLISIGKPKELKQRFGVGYDIQIRMDPRKCSSQVDKIKKDMRLFLDCLLTDENSGYLMYQVKGAGTTWNKIYEVMNRVKSKYDCIDDFLVVVRLST